MFLNFSHIGQIALAVADVDRAEAFYGGQLGLRRLYGFSDLCFFDCAGVRLMLEKARDQGEVARSSVIYFRCTDLALAIRELEGRGSRSGAASVPPRHIDVGKRGVTLSAT